MTVKEKTADIIREWQARTQQGEQVPLETDSLKKEAKRLKGIANRLESVMNNSMNIKARFKTPKIYKMIMKDLNDLSKIYTFRRPSEVVDFLNNNRSLVPFLAEAYDRIIQYFPAATLILEVVTDPEDDHKELVIFIQTTLSPKDAFATLDDLDRTWWLDASLGIGEYICIHVEFE
jgi:hypothetical protein